MDGSFEMFTQDWQPQTSLIRGGLHRSSYQETSEALFLTSGSFTTPPKKPKRRSRAITSVTSTAGTAIRPSLHLKNAFVF